MSVTLATLDDVKQNLGITGSSDDDLLNQLRQQAGDAIERFCGRSFSGGTFVEYFDGGARLLVLANYPVESGTEVRVDPGRFFTSESILSTDRFVVRADRGLISLANGGPFIAGASPHTYPNAVKVIYSTATSSVPDAVSKAYADLIGHWDREVKTWIATDQQNVLTKTDGSVVTEYPWGQSGGFDVPRGVKRLLESFRTPAI